MKYAHNIKITVFAKPEENILEIKTKLSTLIPFNIEEQKTPLIINTVEGFENRKISILEIDLFKEAHTNAFLKSLNEHLTKDQKELLLSQRWSRLDEELYFYIRLDKNSLINNSEYAITDSGDCFHIRIHLAAFPKTTENALKVVEKIFEQ